MNQCGTCGKDIPNVDDGWPNYGYCNIECASESPHSLVLDFPQSLEIATRPTEQGGPGFTERQLEHWKQYVGDYFDRLRLVRRSAYAAAQRLRWEDPDSYVGKWHWMALGASSGIILGTQIVEPVMRNGKPVTW